MAAITLARSHTPPTTIVDPLPQLDLLSDFPSRARVQSAKDDIPL